MLVARNMKPAPEAQQSLLLQHRLPRSRHLQRKLHLKVASPTIRQGESSSGRPSLRVTAAKYRRQVPETNISSRLGGGCSKSSGSRFRGCSSTKARLAEAMECGPRGGEHRARRYRTRAERRQEAGPDISQSAVDLHVRPPYSVSITDRSLQRCYDDPTR